MPRQKLSRYTGRAPDLRGRFRKRDVTFLGMEVWARLPVNRASCVAACKRLIQSPNNNALFLRASTAVSPQTSFSSQSSPANCDVSRPDLTWYCVLYCSKGPFTHAILDATSPTKRASPYPARVLFPEASGGFERKLSHIIWIHSSFQFMIS